MRRWVAAVFGWLLGAVLSAVNAADATDADYLVRNWTTADGLPDNSVRAIVETPDGYLWMGTANGLARFDGVRFTSFDAANTPELNSANIFTLARDRQGGLWLATRRGVFRYHAGKFTAMPRAEAGAQQPISNLVTDAPGDVWMRLGNRLGRWTGERITTESMPEGL